MQRKTSWGLGRGHCPLPRKIFRFWVWKWRLLVHPGCLPTWQGGGHGPSAPPLGSASEYAYCLSLHSVSHKWCICAMQNFATKISRIDSYTVVVDSRCSKCWILIFYPVVLFWLCSMSGGLRSLVLKMRAVELVNSIVKGWLFACRPLRRRSVTCAQSPCTRRSEWKPADAFTTRCASNAVPARTLLSK